MKISLGLGIKPILKESRNILRVVGKQKFFCIGLNKTGTTSIKIAWQELGILTGNDIKAKQLLDSWILRDFNPIIKYCKTAQAFQDSPFSFPYTYIVLDQAFPNSRFILSVRDNAEEWYNSLTRFHTKLWGNGSIPTKQELINVKNTTYGRPWKVNQTVFRAPENDPYNKKVLMDFYDKHLSDVKDYFRHRPDDLLVLNLKDEDSYFRFCKFLEKNPIREDFPWVNKTRT